MKHFLLLFILPCTLFAQNRISLDDIWIKYTFYPNILRDIEFISDSTFTFSEMNYVFEYSITQQSISDSIIYPSAIDSLKFSDYISNSEKSKYLLESNAKDIYRRSSIAQYSEYNTKTKKLRSIADSKQIRIPSYSPNDSIIIYFLENNLFIETEESTMQITSDGKKNEIINGAPDWVYEEEFELKKAYWWSPDSKHIAYLKFNEAAVKMYGIDVYDSVYPNRYSYKYPKVGEKNAIVSIHIYDVETKKTTTVELSDSYEYTTDIQWLNNDECLIQRYNRFQNAHSIDKYTLSSGKIDKLYTETSDTFLEFPNFITILDNHTICFLSDKSGYKHIHKLNTNTKEQELVTNGEYEVSEILHFDKNTKTLFFTSTEVSPLERHVYSISSDGKNKQQLTKTPGTHQFKFSPNSTYIIDNYTNADNHYTMSVYNTNGEIIKTLISAERTKKLAAEYQLQQKEFFTIKTSYNEKLNAYMITPPDFSKNKTYPVLLMVYGGPLRQEVLNDFDYNYYWQNLLVNEGYIIVSVDPRGTGARGRDFNKCTYGMLGQKETEDIYETIDYLQSLKYIDAGRIGIWGWSYGGYMTLMSMCHGDKIKAGIAVAPITDWRFYDSIYTERFMKTTKENKENYIKSSPLQFADELQGKLLLTHGGFDDNVHPQHSYQFAEKLIENNIDFDFFIYPNKNHSIRGGYTRYHLYKKMTDFILENL